MNFCSEDMGALNTLEYAKRKGKEIINLAKPMTCTLA